MRLVSLILFYFFAEIEAYDINIWFQRDGAKCHTA